MAKPAQPRKQPLQRRSRATVTAILDAAARIFTLHGYGTMTTNAVAKLAGVSIGSLYQYFPNKESLICAVFERHRERMKNVIAQEMGATLDVGDFDSIHSLVLAIAAAHLVEPELHAKFEHLRHEEPFFKLLHDKDLDEMRRNLERILTNRKDAFAMGNATLSAHALVTAVHSLIHALTEPLAPYELQKVALEISRMIFGYVHCSGFTRGRSRDPATPPK